MSKNFSSLASRKGVEKTLFEQLAIPVVDKDTRRQELAKEYLLGESKIVGSASFYDFIEGDNAGKKAYMCNGSSCLCAGQQEVERTLTAHFSADQIGHVTCLGRCHENQAFQIDGQNYSGTDIAHLNDILNQDSFDSAESYRVFSPLSDPVFVANQPAVEDFYQSLADLIKTGERQSVLDKLKASNLRGRGGAGFPAGVKWQACADIENDEKYVVCNADEGDPGAFSDRYLLEQRPYQVLYGMALAGWLAGAQYGVLYIRDEYPAAITACEQAIKAFDALMLGAESGWQFRFKIIRGAGAYICGEETALLRSIEGQRPMVSVRPPFPTEQGLFNKPTILNNVETFAAVPWIIDNGADAFAGMGNGRSTGSKLVSMDGSFAKPGIYEVAMSTPLQEVIDMAGGYARDTKALHIGGPLGGLVPLDKVSELTLDFESFHEQGFLLGHASVVGVPNDMPMINYLHHLFEFTAAESCGKCFPCRLGATRGKEMIANAMDDTALIDRTLLDDLLETMQLGSLCALGGGVPLPVQNALQYFQQELQPFFEGDK